MPTYDYRCERCQEQFEFWQSFSDDSLVTCPAEGGPSACVAPGEGPVKKVFSKVGISFKGDGFYKNDHGANAAGRSKESKDSTPAPAKESSDSKATSSDSSSGSSKSGSSESSSSKSGSESTSASSS